MRMLITLSLYCGCGLATVIGADDQKIEYDVFVVESCMNRVLFASIDKQQLKSANIRVERFAIFFKKLLDDTGKCVISSVFDGPSAVTFVTADKLYNPDELQKLKSILQHGLLLHEYEINTDGSVGKKTRCFEMKIPFERGIDRESASSVSSKGSNGGRKTENAKPIHGPSLKEKGKQDPP